MTNDARPASSTADRQTPPAGHAPDWLTSAVRALERASSLDPAVTTLERLSGALLRSPGLEGVLRGDRFGHALHPLLTDFPLGSFLSATVLDLFGGRRSRGAATGLLGFGLAATLPTAAAGAAEWRASGTVSRRVGVVHAAANVVATSLYAGSLLARLRGRHRRGVALALAGGSVAWISGYLGGHLSLVRKIGTADPSFGPVPGPAAG